MKRSMFMLVLLVFATSAWARPSAPVGHFHADHTKKAFRLLEDHFEGTFATADAIQVSAVVKHGHGPFLVSEQNFSFADFTSLQKPSISTTAHSKSYLFHIYPSMHFW